MRIVDPKLIAEVPPSEKTRKLAGDFGLAIATTGVEAIRCLRAHVDTIANEAFAGRWDGVEVAISDAHASMHAFVDVTTVARDIRESIALFDRPYHAALGPVFRFERKRLEVARLRDTPLSAIRSMIAYHKQACRDPHCDAIEILRAAEIRRMGGC